MFNAEARVEPHFFSGFNLGSGCAAALAFLDKALQVRRVFCTLLGERMLCCNRDKACPEQRIGPGGEYVDTVLPAHQIEGEVQPL